MTAPRITAGLPRETAVGVYGDSVNQPDTLFSMDSALPGRLELLREHLHDPISGDEAQALNDVLFRRRRWVDVMAWLQEPDVPWERHFAREAIRTEEADRRLQEYLRSEDERWEANGFLRPGTFGLTPDLSEEQRAELQMRWIEEGQIQYLNQAKSCPQCGTPAGSLKWFLYSTRPSFWASFSGGWRTHCESCVRDVEHFVPRILGRRRRPEVPPDFVSSTD